jgi:hypothetical protein
VALLLLTVAVVATAAAVSIAQGRETAQLENYYSSILLAKTHIDKGNVEQAKELLFNCPERHRHWEWGYLAAQSHQAMATLTGSTNEVAAIEFSPDG